MSELFTYTGGDLATNGYLLPTSQGVLAFDAPEGFAAVIQEQKLKVEALLLTHGHFDHIWDAAAIQHQQGCPVYIHPQDAALLADPTIFQVFGVYGLAAVKDYHELVVPKKGSAVWSQGGHEFTLFHLPGHSPGSVVFYEKSLELVIGGDVLFAGGVGRWDLPGGSQSDLISGINTHLLTLSECTTVYPGHGAATTIGTEKAENFYLQKSP